MLRNRDCHGATHVMVIVSPDGGGVQSANRSTAESNGCVTAHRLLRNRSSAGGIEPRGWAWLHALTWFGGVKREQHYK